MPVLLLTDALMFLVLGISVAIGVHSARHPHLRAPWRQVARSPAAMAAVVVLAFYVAIGLLDSLHFHPRLAPPLASETVASANSAGESAGESGTDEEPGDSGPMARYSSQVLSLLDLWLTPLRERDEKTFSAPFATHLFVKEAIELPDGGTVRAYPRLVHGGAHLADPERDRPADLLRLALRGLLLGLLLWTLLAAALIQLLARRRGQMPAEIVRALRAGETELPWRTILLTLAILLVLSGMAASLAGNYHILGTDKIGEDVFYQTLKSIRTGLVIGTLTTLVMLPAAVALGIMAGYFRGWIDDAIQYLYTTLNSIPGVLLIAAAILMLQVYMTTHADRFGSLVERADLRLFFLCVILGVTSWTGLCRLLRGETLKLREADYAQAARALGVGHFGVLTRHLLPNVLHLVMIVVVLDFSGLVLAEAVLSYVNIGVDPTMHSWGNMINSARLELAREPVVWWSLTAAFVFMFALVLAANLLADAVRDAFDPRLRVTS